MRRAWFLILLPGVGSVSDAPGLESDCFLVQFVAEMFPTSERMGSVRHARLPLFPG